MIENDYKHSSDDQDIIAYELLGERKYFVDVGAGNGIHGSNTFLLEKKYGWSGICIEAHPTHVLMLEQSRACICHKDIISDKKGYSDFCYETVRIAQHYEPSPLRHAYGGGSGLISTHHLQAEKREGWDTQTVKTVTLDDILKQYNAPKHIDFLDIDVEGAELQVLKGIDWENTSFGLINVEDRDDLALNFLKQKGYAKWKTVGMLDTMFKPC